MDKIEDVEEKNISKRERTENIPALLTMLLASTMIEDFSYPLFRHSKSNQVESRKYVTPKKKRIRRANNQNTVKNS